MHIVELQQQAGVNGVEDESATSDKGFKKKKRLWRRLLRTRTGA
jgi:hypothetical protein